MLKSKILIVDDEPEILKASTLMLKSRGYTNIVPTSDPDKVMSELSTDSVGIVILDLYMPKRSGIDVLADIVNEYPNVPVVVMTAVDDADTAVRCMKGGAFDYLVKPVDIGRLISSVTRGLEHHSISNELNSLKNLYFSGKIKKPEAFAEIVTNSPKMEAVFKYLEMISPSLHPVLIVGETGVGKELVAKAVHVLSDKKGAFVAINVGGVDDTFFSDTLFGHRKGAFTGAESNREGLLFKAEGGTIFLDEIGDMSDLSQVKLLRLLQEKEYYPVGSDHPKQSSARLVMATNHDLQELVAAKKFRKDLYYRISAHRITLPPLRERIEDIPLLLEHFLAKAALSCGRKKPTAPKELVNLLSLYDFPGNIREMESMITDSVARHSSGILSMQSFLDNIEFTNGRRDCSIDFSETDSIEKIFGHFPTIREVEDFMIQLALKKCSGNQVMSSSLLGITRQTLNKRMKDLSLN